jgi:DNA (cytosine-5)-methyltransferase 1
VYVNRLPDIVYNEIDPFAAEWLRRLILFGYIAPGDVDERSIEDVTPDDYRGFTQAHFFAGIGVWSYSLRRAGVGDDRRLWTGSCPCQPFSQAGKGAGVADERHLWPAWFHLIDELRPERILGEQVASKDGLAWLDLVHADLEGAGYAVGAVDLCAAGVGAPHIRQRLFFTASRLADAGLHERAGRRAVAADDDRRGGQGVERGRQPASRGAIHGLADADQQFGHGAGDRGARGRPEHSERGATGGLADADHALGRAVQPGRDDGHRGAAGRQQGHGDAQERGRTERLADAEHGGREAGEPAARRAGEDPGAAVPCGAGNDDRGPGPVNGLWSAADWLFCRDGKWRPVEPGTFPLAHGAPARVGRLRGYGNAINAEVAKAFIEAAMSVAP